MLNILKNLDWTCISVYVIWPIVEGILFVITPKLMLSLIIASGITLYVMIHNESVGEQS